MGRTTDRPVSLVSPHGKTREDTIRNDRRQSFNPKVGGSIPPRPTENTNWQLTKLHDRRTGLSSPSGQMQTSEIRGRT